MIITLTFNTTEKTVLLQTTYGEQTYLNVPTVKISQDGYYEVIQEDERLKSEGATHYRFPVLRVPIGMTLMNIIK